MIFQMRAIDKKRLLKKFGRLSSDDMQKVDAEIRQILSL
jgi:mRNA-degrading endonuclease toxin of MazEF toxin-antitoxin module